MRGSDERCGSLFSYVDLEGSGSAGSSVADDPRDSECGVGGSDGGVCGALPAAAWPTFDPAGTAVAGDAAAGVLWPAVGAATDGADGVRSSVPLVRGAGGG